MSLILWFKDGKEVKQATKGRGRPPKGAIQVDGDWIIYEGAKPAILVEHKPVIQVVKPKKLPIPEIALDDDEVVEQHGDSKVFHEKPIELDFLVGSIYFSKSDFSENSNQIDIFRPVIVRKTPLRGILYNAAYAKIEINKQSGEMLVWSSYATGTPTYVLKNVLIPCVGTISAFGK